MKIKIGIENFVQNVKIQKHFALLTNPTGISSDLKADLDLLVENNVNVVKLFGPEHGISGAEADGIKVENEVEPRYKIPIYSLYGSHLRPTDEMLDRVDAVIYDIQDVGLRFYTYIYTLAYMMEECGKRGIKVIVLDRPNPLSAKIEGPVIKKKFESFVGGYGLPLRYGLTIGELATYYNDFFKMNVDLEVVKMEGWSSMYYDETGLLWNTPSPNLPSLEHTILYEGFCLLEGINVSVGRGTVHPFKYIGAPWMDDRIYEEMQKIPHPGIEFRKRAFIPLTSKYKDERCNGLEFFVTDRNKIRPIEFALNFIRIIKNTYPQKFEWEIANGKYHFDLLIGDAKYREGIDEGQSGEDLSKLWIDEVREFKRIASKYFIYRR